MKKNKLHLLCALLVFLAIPVLLELEGSVNRQNGGNLAQLVKLEGLQLGMPAEQIEKIAGTPLKVWPPDKYHEITWDYGKFKFVVLNESSRKTTQIHGHELEINSKVLRRGDDSDSARTLLENLGLDFTEGKCVEVPLEGMHLQIFLDEKGKVDQMHLMVTAKTEQD